MNTVKPYLETDRTRGYISTFNPIDHGFRWVDDWYEFDSTQAHQAAKDARDQEARRLKATGRKVKRGTVRNQLISRGGIGSGHPHIDLFVHVYTVGVL